MAKEMLEYMRKMAEASQAGTLKRAQSPHKTNVHLVEVAHA